MNKGIDEIPDDIGQIKLGGLIPPESYGEVRGGGSSFNEYQAELKVKQAIIDTKQEMITQLIEAIKGNKESK